MFSMQAINCCYPCLLYRDIVSEVAAKQSVTSAEVPKSIWDNTTNVKISAHQSGSARD